MERHTSTVVAVPSQADTQKSPVDIAWSTTGNALTTCSLGIRSQDSPPSHSPIALRCPENGRELPMGTVINPQRDLMQDVGPEVSAHVEVFGPRPSLFLFLWHILLYYILYCRFRCLF